MAYTVDANGNIRVFSKYNRLGSITLVDILPNTKEISKLLVLKNNENFRNHYNRRNKAAVTRKILFDFLELVIYKLMSGGMFEMPTKSKANIVIKKLKEEGIRKYQSLGYIDTKGILASNYNIPVLKYDFGPKSTKKDRYIYLPKYFAKILMNNAADRNIKYTYYKKKYDI